MVKKLSTQAFVSARSQLKTGARPLELRMYERFFENGAVEASISELAKFQNPDGGFGNALEPDFRLPLSSPMATSVALQKLRAVKAPQDHPVIARAIQYLLAAYDPHKGYWSAVPREVNDYPHAPWWQFDQQAGKSQVETPANPSAELLGYLYAYPAGVPQDFLQQLTDFLFNHLQSLPDKMDMHDLICFVRMAEQLPPDKLSQVQEKISTALQEVVEKGPKSWDEYGPQPLMYVQSPRSPFYPLLQKAVEANLDYRIKTQDPAGGWSPNWTWAEAYPQDWQVARRDWQGVLTLDALRVLKAFDRLPS